MRWRRGIQVLERRRGEVQIGTDPRWAVRVGGLDRAESRMLRALSDLDEVPLSQLAQRHEVSPERSSELLELLSGTRVVAPEVHNRRGTNRDPLAARLGDDLQVRSLLLDDADGAAQVGARSARCVHVEGLGRTGMMIAVALAAAGVGTVVPVDPRVVGPQEPGVGGIVDRDVGEPRDEAAAQILMDASPGVVTTSETNQQIDVVVLVDSYATDPERTLAWHAAKTAVLPVVVREGDVSVGPFVAPGRGPCLQCVGLHLSDADRDWPLIAAQLCARGQRTPAPQESLLAHVAGSFAASQVVAAIDGLEPATTGASFEFALPQGVGVRREWAVHPQCACTSPPPA